MRASPEMTRAVRDVGYGVMSFAGNHCLDWGYDAFDDTLTHAAQAGVALCGAGQTLAVARQPAIVTTDGISVAVLARSAILPEGYAAEARKSGCAPLRAFTFYEQIEHDQPGTPARVISHAHRGDLADLVADVRAARACADIVLVSLHWGIHMIEVDIADYQREVAHAVVAAGAHAILGHHPHLLKGVEMIAGAPVFYSLGNFAIEQPHIWDERIVESDSFRHLVSLNPAWRPGAVYMLPEVTRMTGIARLTCSKRGVEHIAFLPAWIEDDSAPVMLASTDPRHVRVAAYLEQISRAAGFATRFEPDAEAIGIGA